MLHIPRMPDTLMSREMNYGINGEKTSSSNVDAIGALRAPFRALHLMRCVRCLHCLLPVALCSGMSVDCSQRLHTRDSTFYCILT